MYPQLAILPRKVLTPVVRLTGMSKKKTTNSLLATWKETLRNPVDCLLQPTELNTNPVRLAQPSSGLQEKVTTSPAEKCLSCGEPVPADGSIRPQKAEKGSTAGPDEQQKAGGTLLQSL